MMLTAVMKSGGGLFKLAHLQSVMQPDTLSQTTPEFSPHEPAIRWITPDYRNRLHNS